MLQWGHASKLACHPGLNCMLQELLELLEFLVAELWLPHNSLVSTSAEVLLFMVSTTRRRRCRCKHVWKQMRAALFMLFPPGPETSELPQSSCTGVPTSPES